MLATINRKDSSLADRSDALSLDSKFRFSCHKCGTCCCGSMLLYLSPLDLWWMKRNLQCPTSVLIDQGIVKVVSGEKYWIPKAIMGMREIRVAGKKQHVCHLIKANYVESNVGRNDKCPCGSGKKYKHCCAENANKIMCECWEDRPATCRLYPLWYVVYWHEIANQSDTIFKMTTDKFCKGCSDNKAFKEYTVDEWVNKDDKLRYALGFNKKFANYMKLIAAMKEVDNNKINYIANILYNFDSWMDDRLIIGSDNDFADIYFDKLEELVSGVNTMSGNDLLTGSAIIS